MTRLILALALSLAACATLSSAKDPSTDLQAFTPVKDRTIQIVGVVGSSMQDKILQMAYMAIESNDPIYIMINSPGGYVSYGEQFMQAMTKMQQRGVVIKCVANEAASMAMYILNQCDERYVVLGAKLLWHPVKAFVREAISSRIAERLAKELREIDDYYRVPLREKLAVDDESFEKYRWEEKWWTVEEIMVYSPLYVTPVSGVEGVAWDAPAPDSPFGQIKIKSLDSYILFLIAPGFTASFY